PGIFVQNCPPYRCRHILSRFRVGERPPFENKNLKYYISERTGQAEQTPRDLEQRLELLTSERDSLKMQVDQYEDALERQADSAKRGKEMYADLERRCAKSEALVAQNKISGGAREELNSKPLMVSSPGQCSRSTGSDYSRNSELSLLNQAKDSRISELNDQIRYLRSMQENTERLEEENLALSQRITRMLQNQDRSGELALEVAHLKAEKARWTKFLEKQDDTGIDSPYTLSRKLAELQEHNRQLRLNNGIDSIKQQQFNIKITRLERTVSEWQSWAQVLEEQFEISQGNLQRAERSRGLAQETNNMLRAAAADNDEKPKCQELVKQYQDYVKTLEKQLDNVSMLPTPTGPTNIFDLLGYKVEVKDGGVHLKAEKARWTKFLQDYDDTGIDSPYTLSRKLAELEKNNRQLRLNYGIDNIKNQQFQNKMTSLERSVSEWQSWAKHLEEKFEITKGNLQRAERGRGLAQEANHILRAAMAGSDENSQSQELLNQYQD
ncbi:hypothetical protein DFS34DRAFT_659086, partial [Phlyctochytrium arcticum]